MHVRLCDFTKQLVKELGILRPNKGPSIVPLMIVHFANDGIYPRENPWNRPLLFTVCQRTGNVFHSDNLSKLYSMGRFCAYDEYTWWTGADVLNVRPRSILSPASRLLEIYAKVNRHTDYDNYFAG